jgi:hypothetical protein
MFESDPTPACQPEGLPEGFDREERAVDELLASAAMALSQTTPLGLSQRVFDAVARHAGQRGCPEQLVAPAEALPAEFDSDLMAIDSLLAISSRGGVAAPEGLAERVYHASVVHLPAAPGTAAPLRLVAALSEVPGTGSTPAMSFRWSLWQRLSLAASVAIVGGLALWALMQEPVPQPIISHADPESKQSDARLAAEITSQFHALNNLTDELSDFESQVTYLLDATQILSVADLNPDFGEVTPRIDT